MIFILGLLARSGHGKTTVARHLVDRFGAEIRSLAAPMKRAVQNVFGFSDGQLWGTQAEKEAIDARYGFSPRWLLQRLGTEGLRAELGEDVHVRGLLHGLRREEAALMNATAPSPAVAGARRPRLIVVDDVRFPNDARFIAVGGPDHRGAVLKIVATDVAPPAHGVHASESAIDHVAPEDIAATIVSSRAEGVDHLLAGVERVLRTVAAFESLRSTLR